ncbi:MAG: S8 family serine peptidase, partial [Lachnospiraceae bacterium]
MRKRTGIRILAWMLMVSVLVSLLAPAGAKAEAGVTEDFTPRRIMIKREKAGENASGEENYSTSFYWSYEPSPETEITDTLSVMDADVLDLCALYYDRSIISMEEDAELSAAEIPCEEFAGDNAWAMQLAGMGEAREKGSYGYGVKIAILDTAVDGTLVPVTDTVSFLTGESTGKSVADGNLLHGTAVASILCGLVPGAEFYSVEVLDADGKGYYSSLIQGIYWAVENGMDILVMSLGGETYSAFLQEALLEASYHDIVVAAAAGNEDGGNILFPAAYAETLSVGALDENGSPFVSYADGEADCYAPGKNICLPDGRGTLFSGTSAAVPFAAAAAALLRGADKDLSREQVMALLINTSEILDAAKAIAYKDSPVYTRLTNRGLTLSALEEMEAERDGEMEAQILPDSDSTEHAWIKQIGEHTSKGHSCTKMCTLCGLISLEGYVTVADCPKCNPKPTPTTAPTATQTPKPTQAPTTAPTATPTPKPTTAPTKAPTATPTPKPTTAPTKAPTATPTPKPTTAPTKAPTATPTPKPTTAPTQAPTKTPTPKPTTAPTAAPTVAPTLTPTPEPTPTPIYPATVIPTPTDAVTPTPTNPPYYPATPIPMPTRPIDNSTLQDASYGGEMYNQASGGDPVNVITGNFYMSLTDLYFAGIGDSPVAITRSYNSLDTGSGLFGKGWSFSYESSLSVVSSSRVKVTYADGRILVFQKNGNSYTAEATKDILIKNGDGTWSLATEEKKTWNYSSTGKLLFIADRNGNKITFTYGSNGSLTKITGSDGIAVTVTCQNGRISKLTDPFGRTVTYAYDSQNRLIKVSGETCGTMSYTYDSHGITSVTDGNGATYLTNKYDSRGRVVLQTDEDGNRTRFVYDDEAQENSCILENSGNVTRYRYNDKLYVIRINYADGSYEKYAYDSDGNRTMARAKSGYVTRYTYDENGNMLSCTNALGETAAFAYDERNNLIRLTTPEGGSMAFSYDEKDNLTQMSVLIEEGSVSETSYTYDERGRLLSVTDACGAVTKFFYEKGGQPVRAENALGGMVTYRYDAIGRRTESETVYGKTAYEYNEKDQIVSITDAEGGVTAFFYDSIGNITKMVLPNQQEQAVKEGLPVAEAKGYTYAYDSMDRIIAVNSPEKAVTDYLYDMEGKLVSESMPEYAGAVAEDKNYYCYTYDSVGNLIQVTAPDGGITTYAYDAAGNLIAVTEPEGQETGVQVRYTYDALNRVTSITDTLGQIRYRYAYDKDGNVISVMDAGGYTTWYTYSKNGWLLEARIPKKEETGVVWYQVIRYTYDKAGRVTAVASGKNFVKKDEEPKEWDMLAYTYDAAGNAVCVSDSDGAEVYYTYDSFSMLLTQEIVAGEDRTRKTVYEYDGNGNLTGIKEADGEVQMSYYYDPNGNVTEVRLPEGEVLRYTYDATDRLIRKEEEVQVDTLELKHNTVSVDFEEERNLYPETTFSCTVSVKLADVANEVSLELLYDDRLLSISTMEMLVSNATVDTSESGKITLSTEKISLSGTQKLLRITFSVKEGMCGTAYVMASPDCSFKPLQGDFLFSESRGLLADVTLPDYNGDRITDLRDFALLAGAYGTGEGDTGYESRYDITGNGLVDKADLDYVKELLFAGRTGAEQLTAEQVADRILQPVYTVRTTTEIRTTSYEYDAADRLIAVTDCNGNRVTYTYDACGRLETLTDKDGGISTVTYDRNGNALSVAMPGQYREFYAYDTENRLVSVTDALGNRTAYTYDAYGRLKSVTDAVGICTEYRYDIAGNLTENLATGEKYCYNVYDEVI